MCAADLLRELHEQMRDGYAGDCLKHARALIDALRGDGCDAWLGRLRLIERRGDATIHHPLIPLRYRDRGLAHVPAWTTHYVACCDGEAWDPLIGTPIPLADLAMTAFGVAIEVVRVDERSPSS